MELVPSSGFPYYISLVSSSDLKLAFAAQENIHLLSSLTNEQAEFRYAPGKWSLKQILGHITDHERIMTYRALRFSRKDTTQLPGYDQELFVANSRFEELEYKQLLEDFINVRQATRSLINTLSVEQFKLKGFAWKFEISVEDLLKAALGHESHHVKIINELYLKIN